MDFIERIGWPATIAGLSLLFVVGFWRVPACIEFQQDIEGHLKRAADANTIELAKTELSTAIDGIQRWGLCGEDDPNHPLDCYTSILYRTPDEDIGFWRTNLEAALADLSSVPEDASHLTISNALMKLRETVLDDSKDGVAVTAPSGVYVYPDNALLLWLLIVGGVLTCLGGWGISERY